MQLPARAQSAEEPFWTTATKGIRIYLATPRLRGLMVMEMAVAAAGAMVYVNTVVLVQARLGLGPSQVALAFAAFGAGSMLAALTLPKMLESLADRPVMLTGASLMVAAVAIVPLVNGLGSLMPLWFLIGFGFSLTQTPIGRIVNRSAQPQDRPAVFAAQFALSHACWLVTYPMAGWIGAGFGLNTAALALTGLGLASLAVALRLWPATDLSEVPHSHADLPAGHPHLALHGASAHSHAFTIDGLHPRWPK